MNQNKLKKNGILKLFAKIKLPKRERNDIVLDIESIIQLFADDTSMYTHLENLDIYAEILNSDLEKVSNWAKQSGK